MRPIGFRQPRGRLPAYARSGDILAVWRLDRSLRHLLTVAAEGCPHPFADVAGGPCWSRLQRAAGEYSR